MIVWRSEELYAGELTKKVEFMNGLLSGRSYDVTVNPNAKSVTLQEVQTHRSEAG